MIQHIGNFRTPNSVFDNQACTGSFAALNSHVCSEVLITLAPSGTAIPNVAMVRRGSTGGQIYVSEYCPIAVAVRGNSNELQVMTSQGTTPTVGYECKSFASGPPPGLP